MRSVDFASIVFLIVVIDSTLLLGVFPASSFIHIILIGLTLSSGFRDSHFTQTKDSDTWDFSFFLELLKKDLLLLQQICESKLVVILPNLMKKSETI